MLFAVAGAGLIVFCVLAACLVLCLPVFRIVSLWLENGISTGEALLAIFALLSFLAGIMRTWGQPISILLWLLLVGLALIIFLGGRFRDRKRLDQFFRADVAAAERALERDPENAAAHMRLGNLHEQQREFEAAIQHYQEVVRLVPRDSEGRLILASCIEKRRRAVTGHLVCWRCGRENATDAAHCRSCGSLISDRNLIARWLTSPRVSRGVTAIALGSLTVAVGGSLARIVPLWIAIACYGLLFLAVLCYVYPRWSQPKV